MNWQVFSVPNCTAFANVQVPDILRDDMMRTLLAQDWIQYVRVDDDGLMVFVHEVARTTEQELKRSLEQLCEDVVEPETVLDLEIWGDVFI